MKIYQIEITGPAVEDIAGLRRHITSELMEPGSALRGYESVKKAILSLDEMSERHAVIQEPPYTELGVRRMYIENYTVFYIVDTQKERVTILRVLYSRRDWKRILDGKEEIK